MTFLSVCKMRRRRSCRSVHRHSAVPAVFLCSEALGDFCTGHAPAASPGDVYEKWCTQDSCGVTFWWEEIGDALWEWSSLFTFNSIFIRNSISSSCSLINWPGSQKSWLLLSCCSPLKHCKCAWMVDMYGGDMGWVVALWRSDSSTAPYR